MRQSTQSFINDNDKNNNCLGLGLGLGLGGASPKVPRSSVVVKIVFRVVKTKFRAV